MASLGVTAPLWFYAIENPNGFERLMYSFSEYKRTGRFPNPSNVLTVSTEDLSISITENLIT